MPMLFVTHERSGNSVLVHTRQGLTADVCAADCDCAACGSRIRRDRLSLLFSEAQNVTAPVTVQL
jgi:hypothetical protein